MSDAATSHDRWSSGDAYEAYVGRWSRQVAEEFIDWLDVPRGARWLDAGCGTGALTATVRARRDPVRAIGVDPSTAFVSFAGGRISDAVTSFVNGDGTALPFADGSFDAAVSGLVLNFVPEPGRMAAEMARVTRGGGCVALYVWDYGGRMEMMRHFWDAVIELDPVARRYDEGMRFSICRADRLEALFREAGLSAVEARDIDIPTRFPDFNDYWSPFLRGTGTAPGYVASLEEEDRAALRELVRRRLPLAADGSISLIARAIAVRGRRA